MGTLSLESRDNAGDHRRKSPEDGGVILGKVCDNSHKRQFSRVSLHCQPRKKASLALKVSVVLPTALRTG